MIEGHGKKLLEIPFSAYSDAALAIQITNPMPPTPFGTWRLNTPEFILQHMKTQFDALYERGADKPVLMPLTVHDFIIGRPSRSHGARRVHHLRQAVRRRRVHHPRSGARVVAANNYQQ